MNTLRARAQSRARSHIDSLNARNHFTTEMPPGSSQNSEGALVRRKNFAAHIVERLAAWVNLRAAHEASLHHVLRHDAH